MKSRVYFIEAKIEDKKSLIFKLEGIFATEKINIEKDEIVAIKIHMGEYGNTRYIRPIFIRKIADIVKTYGGLPFITDTTALYRYRRHNLFEYLETAAMNGFSASTMNCPIIIADGLKDNGVEVELKEAYKLNKIKVAQAIYDADFLISAAHLTYHPFLTPAANIKNIAMGCVVKETKFKMHAHNVTPQINEEKCKKCKECIKNCSVKAIQEDEIIKINEQICIRCGACISVCKEGAINVPWTATPILDVQKAMIDGVRGVFSVFKKEKLFFINFALDITEHCDCLNRADLPVIRDIGILASTDVVALDKATYDMMTEAQAYPTSLWEKKLNKEIPTDALIDKEAIETFFKLANNAHLGNLDYEIIKI